MVYTKKGYFVKQRRFFVPIHEYQCERCKHSFEKLIFLSDDETISCPKCSNKNVKKLVSASSFMSSAGIGICAANAPKGFS